MGINLDETRDILGLAGEAGSGTTISPGGTSVIGGEFGQDLTVTLSPEQQAIQDQLTALSGGTAGAAQGLLGQLNLGGLGDLGLEESQAGLDRLTGNRARNRAERAVFRRGNRLLRPGQRRERNRVEGQLAARGIPTGLGEAGLGGSVGRGSEQGQLVLGDLNRRQGAERENLALSSVIAGGQEQSRLLQGALASQGQQFGQRFQLGLANSQLPLDQLSQLMGLTQVQQPLVQSPGGVPVQGALGTANQGNNPKGLEQGSLIRDLLVGGLGALGNAF